MLLGVIIVPQIYGVGFSVLAPNVFPASLSCSDDGVNGFTFLRLCVGGVSVLMRKTS